MPLLGVKSGLVSLLGSGWCMEVVAHPAKKNNTDLAIKIARKYQGRQEERIVP